MAWVMNKSGTESLDMEQAVITITYGVKRKWAHRKDAVAFFWEAVLSCEGAEKERYFTVLEQLHDGTTVATDIAT